MSGTHQSQLSPADNKGKGTGRHIAAFILDSRASQRGGKT